MDKFEYVVKEVPIGPGEFAMERINTLGKQGWELVAAMALVGHDASVGADSFRCVFRRWIGDSSVEALNELLDALAGVDLPESVKAAHRKALEAVGR